MTGALRSLGGRATRGDLVMATALPLADVEEALDRLLAEDRVQVAVSESAVVVYRLHERRMEPRRVGVVPSGREPSRASRWRRAAQERLTWARAPATLSFDRKTLRLIRARAGVLSLAELVEHTGLTVREAKAEAERLTRLFGGEAHPSWDGHVVYAFPHLVESAHGDFHVREPRPAWARAQDPLRRRNRPRAARSRLLASAGAAAAGVMAWMMTFPPAGEGRALILASVAGATACAAFAATAGVLRRIGDLPRFRLRRPETLRRFALGYIFETALKGKGVISLRRTVDYLSARTDGRPVRRSTVEGVLRRLADEFDAPVTELDDDLFFGFRNVKRQFLASHVQRIRLRLERRAAGRTMYDSGDSELAAAERELEAFDQALLESPLPTDPLGAGDRGRAYET